MYDPALGRFISADSIVPGAASGAGGAAMTLGRDTDAAMTPLTVDFHEPGFVGEVNQETAFTQSKGFAFQLSDRDRQQAKNAQGPANVQALNRYSYTLNNPLRYIDPTGHFGISWEYGVTIYHLTHEEADAAWNFMQSEGIAIVQTIISLVTAGLSGQEIVKWIQDASLSAKSFLAALALSLLADMIAVSLAFGARVLVAVTVATGAFLAIALIDNLFGEQGFDVMTVGPAMVVLPPTVERQHGLWVNGVQICHTDFCRNG